MLKKLALVAFAALLCAGAADLETVFKIVDREVAQTKYPQPVTAKELGSDYENNSVRADRMYNDKIMVVTGPVRNISRNPVTGLAFISLSTVTPEAWRAGNEHLAPRDVNCYFSKDREFEAERLYKRQPEVKLVGKVAGSTGFEITLYGCRVYYER